MGGGGKGPRRIHIRMNTRDHSRDTKGFTKGDAEAFTKDLQRSHNRIEKRMRNSRTTAGQQRDNSGTADKQTHAKGMLREAIKHSDMKKA